MDLIKQNISLNFKTDNEYIKECLSLIEWAINQEELRYYIINFRNQYNYRSFLQTNDSNYTTLKKFVSGAENDSKADYTWDSVVHHFISDGSVVAYTEDGKTIININDEYLDREIQEVCNTLVHEYCHLVGMRHNSLASNTSWESYQQSAPYAIGAYVQYLIEKKLGIETKKPSFEIVCFRRRLAYKTNKFIRRLF